MMGVLFGLCMLLRLGWGIGYFGLFEISNLLVGKVMGFFLLYFSFYKGKGLFGIGD